MLHTSVEHGHELRVGRLEETRETTTLPSTIVPTMTHNHEHMETTTHNHPHDHESTMMHTHTTSDTTTEMITTTHAHNHNHHTTTMHTHTTASDADTTEQGGEEGTGSLEEVGSGGHEGHEGHEGDEGHKDGQGGTMDPCKVDISTLLC